MTSFKHKDHSNNFSQEETFQFKIQKEMMLSDDLMDLVDMFSAQKVDLNFYKRVRSDYEKSRRDPR